MHVLQPRTEVLDVRLSDSASARAGVHARALQTLNLRSRGRHALLSRFVPMFTPGTYSNIGACHSIHLAKSAVPAACGSIRPSGSAVRVKCARIARLSGSSCEA